MLFARESAESFHSLHGGARSISFPTSGHLNTRLKSQPSSLDSALTSVHQTVLPQVLSLPHLQNRHSRKPFTFCTYKNGGEGAVQLIDTFLPMPPQLPLLPYLAPLIPRLP